MEYKPLKDLANDEQALEKIFDFVTDGYDAVYGDFDISELGYIAISELDEQEPRRRVFIDFEGSIEHHVGDNSCGIENQFAIVDFVRSLGYSA